MATDLDPCRATVQLENEVFATNSKGNTIKRIEDETLVSELRKPRKFNTLEVVRTEITTAAKKIELPEVINTSTIFANTPACTLLSCRISKAAK